MKSRCLQLLAGNGETGVEPPLYKCTCFGDEKEAIALLEEEAKNNNGKAMWMLGLCFEYGIGVERDMDQAYRLYSMCGEENKIGAFLWRRRRSESATLEITCLLESDTQFHVLVLTSIIHTYNFS